MIKYVFTDVDYSFFGDNRQVTNENIEAIQKLKAKGIGFSFQSGRLACSLDYLMDQVGVNHSDKDFIICGNGALICDTNRKVLFESAFEHSNVIKLLDYFYEIGLPYFNMVSNGMYYCNNLTPGRSYPHNDHLIADKKTMYEFADNEKIYKFLIHYESHEFLVDLNKKIFEVTGGQIDGVFSSADYLEVVNTGINKGSALKKFCELQGIDIKETLAIGDNYNDETMLAVAGHSACPSNAVDYIKNKVEYISPCDCNHSAFAEIVNHFVFEEN